MDVEILARRENLLLKRVEVTFKAIHKAEPTPTRDALRAELAKHLKASGEVVVVDRAASTFGRYETHGYAKIYKTREEALAVERRYVLVRNRLVAAEAKPAEGEAAKKPAPKPEKPAAKKEEAKPEAKPEKAPVKAEKPPPKVAPKEERRQEKKPEKPEAKKAAPKKEGK